MAKYKYATSSCPTTSGFTKPPGSCCLRWDGVNGWWVVVAGDCSSGYRAPDSSELSNLPPGEFDGQFMRLSCFMSSS